MKFCLSSIGAEKERQCLAYVTWLPDCVSSQACRQIAEGCNYPVSHYHVVFKLNDSANTTVLKIRKQSFVLLLLSLCKFVASVSWKSPCSDFSSPLRVLDLHVCIAHMSGNAVLFEPSTLIAKYLLIKHPQAVCKVWQ